MKAILLAGGRGERLRPLTDTMPKCLAPIAGTPLLKVWLDLCARHAITDVLLNVSRHAHLVRAFLDSYGGPVHVTLVEEAHPRGSAGTVRDQRRFVDGEESFFVLYSDNLTDADLGRLWTVHEEHDALVTLGLFRTAYPQMAGIVGLEENGRVRSFVEKPTHPDGDLANAGIYVIRRPVLDLIPSGATVDFAHDVFPACRGRMRGHLIEEYLLDIGHPAALARAQVEWPARSLAPASQAASALS